MRITAPLRVTAAQHAMGAREATISFIIPDPITHPDFKKLKAEFAAKACIEADGNIIIDEFNFAVANRPSPGAYLRCSRVWHSTQMMMVHEMPKTSPEETQRVVIDALSHEAARYAIVKQAIDALALTATAEN